MAMRQLSYLTLLSRRKVVPFDPTVLSGLELWCNGDDGLIVGGSAQLYDRSYMVAGSTVNPGTSDFSLNLWAYPDSLATDGSLFCTGAVIDGEDGFHLKLITDGSLYLGFNDSVQGTKLGGTIAAAGSITASAWHNISVTFDRDGNASCRINDVAKSTLAISTHTASLGATRTRIGNDGGTTYFNGRLSDFVYSTRLHTAAEITWLNQSGNPRSYAEFGTAGAGSNMLTGLVHDWPMHEISSTRYDQHGSNDLTPTFDNLLGTYATFAEEE
jgi:hypothetical protein